VDRRKKEWAAEDEYQAEWVPWFRGEANADWPTRLMPRLYRGPSRTKTQVKQLLYADQEIRLAFSRSAAQLTQGSTLDHWRYYFLMQAYGAPTRLLDWTDAALVALYFAVQSRARANDREGTANAVVYMLDPAWLNAKIFSKYKAGTRPEGVALSDWDEAKPYLPADEFASERLRPQTPLAVDPVHVASRMAAQRAHFTIFGRDPDGLASCSTRKDSRLVKFKIAYSAIPNIRSQLNLVGVSEFALFPDLEGLGRELGYFWEELVK
jgi:hypothetical protein